MTDACRPAVRRHSCTPASAQAQAYPNRPIKVVVPFPAGRADRRHGAHHLRAARRGARPDHRHREPRRRRRRQRRRQGGRERRSRRLHHSDDAGRIADERPGRAPQHRLRSAQGVHAGRPAHRVAADHVRASGRAGEDACRSLWPTPRPIRASSPGARRASARARTCSPKCSSSKPASTSCTCPIAAPRPMLAAILAGEVQMVADASTTSLPHIQAGKLRPLARADGRALFETAGRADHRRGRLSEAARAVLARRGRAGRHPARHRRQAQRRVPRQPEPAGDARTARRTSAPRSDRHARGFGKMIDNQLALWKSVVAAAGIKAE